jgi:MFS family permease
LATLHLPQSLIRVWPALRSGNFRLFIAGQAVSLVGTYMQQVAMGWLVYRLTQSAFMLGLVGFVGELPGVAVAAFAGVIADRVNPQRIVLVTQTLAMVQAFLLAALVFTGHINVAGILILSCALGLVNGLDVPARQVFLLQLLDREDDLPNAVALNSFVLDSARLIGSALAGALIATYGEAICFLANGASYIAVIAALLAMRLSPPAMAPHPENVVAALARGLRFAFGFAPIRTVLLVVAFVAFAGAPYTVLMPVMASTVLGGGPYTMGILMASTGLGALVGAFYLGSWRTTLGLDRLIPLGASLFGGGLILFALSRSLGLSALCLVIAGFGIMIFMASSNSILLAIAPADKRGRVMSLFTLSFMATVPVGSLYTGALASSIGAAPTIVIGGGLCVIAALGFLWRRYRIGPDVS